MKTIKFRGQRFDTREWVYGDFVRHEPFTTLKSYIKPSQRYQIELIEVIPETVGQLRYTSPEGTEYYDGDIYSHAGYGEETVSDLCGLQLALLEGNNKDIGPIIGNIHTK